MTIKDIARISGCGISTVSRALNDHPDVSQETKDKIKQIAKENRFVPNSNAKQLKQQVSNCIVILVKGSFNLFFASIIEQMQTHISRLGYETVIHYLNEDENEVRMAEQLCNEIKPLGITFLGGNPETFRKRFSNIAIPCILSTTSAQSLSFENLSSVSVDDVKCARQAVDYLFAHGHTHIGIVGGNEDISCTSGLRYAGCRQSFKEHGQELTEENFEQAHFNTSAGYEAAKKLLQKNPKLTAIFAMSDMLAFGTIRAISDLGFSVPNDISVIGFDGIELANYYCPKLTTIRQPCENIAVSSAKMLVGAIHGTEQAQHLLLDAEIIEGDSVRSL